MVSAESSVPGNILSSEDRTRLLELLAENVRFDVPLAPRTSMRVGGPAAAFATMLDVPTLVRTLAYCHANGLAWTILGLGSNVLVRDEGFAGIVLRLAGAFTAVSVNGTRVRAGGAAPIVAVCREAARAGLTGAEALVGIPGTIGGAVRMNAGTNVEIGALVRRIEIVQAGEELQTFTVPEFAYRRSSLDRGAVVCAAELELQPAAQADVQQELRRRIDQRNASQPLELPNSGSIFRNPPGDYAARLIESAGCKGWQCGKAEVSRKHANFIVNNGGATCKDVLALIEQVRVQVKKVHGIELELEVQLLG